MNGDYQVKVTVNDDALKNVSTKQIENVVEEAFSNTIKQVKDMTNEKMKNLSDMGVKDFGYQYDDKDIEELIDAFSNLPGIGKKTAQN